jgi:hypothetical protein
MRRLLLLPALLLALLAAAPLATAEEGEEADESALIEEAIAECEANPICMAEALADEAETEADSDAEAESEAEETYPPECVLRSARAHAVLKENKLKLTIGYTASAPTKAGVDLRYGATRLGHLERRLGRSGVLRIAKVVKGKQGARRLPLRIALDPAGTACPTRRLVLVPKG